MPQFFVPQSLTPGEEIQLSGADAKHIFGSLRLRADDWIVLSDGEGHSARAIILEASSRCVRCRIEEALHRSQPYPSPVLALATIRPERFTFALQKCVELGIAHVIPFHAERTIRPLSVQSATAKRERWQRIALEAAKQSGLPFRPQIESPISFQELLARVPRFRGTLLLYEGERQRSFRSAAETQSAQSPDQRNQPALLIIGPEGGFSDAEVKAAREAGTLTVSLGQQILRVETAAIVATALFQYELGNLDPEQTPCDTLPRSEV